MFVTLLPALLGPWLLWGCTLQRDLSLTSHPLVCLTSSEDIQTTLGARKLNPFRLEATTTVRLAMHIRCSTWHMSTLFPFETSKAYIKNAITSIITNNKYRFKCIKCCIVVVFGNQPVDMSYQRCTVHSFSLWF